MFDAIQQQRQAINVTAADLHLYLYLLVTEPQHEA
jgi:hypothetical protein